jgi:hypothetical protein
LRRRVCSEENLAHDPAPFSLYIGMRRGSLRGMGSRFGAEWVIVSPLKRKFDLNLTSPRSRS